MTYSSGIFLNDNDDLLTSQNNKYDNILRNLDVQSSDIVLEVGSGWGGFIKRNYEVTKCQVEGLTISNQQFTYVNELIKNNKLISNSKIILKDYRNNYEKDNTMACRSHLRWTARCILKFRNV